MKKIIVLFVSLLSLISCVDNVVFPLIITGIVTDIDSDGAVFHAKITDLGDDDILEYGFVWDTIHNPSIENGEKFIFNKQPDVGNYMAKISNCLEIDDTYYVKAFIRSAKVITYGKEVSFVSRGGKLPEITYISPVSGNLNDTLVIVGKYFSSKTVQVRINQIYAQIIKLNKDTVHAIIPSTLDKKTSEVSLKNANHKIVAKDSFTLISPILNSFEAKTGTYGDEVTITGENFFQSPSTVKVFFDKTLATSYVNDDQTIRAIVPNNLDKADCTISVVMNNLITESVERFSLLPVEMTDFNPKTILTGGTITITGKNFSPTISKNKVYIGGVLAKSVAVTKNSLQVTLSLQDTAVYPDRNVSVNVVVGGNASTINDKLMINDQWFRRANAPFELYSAYSNCTTCNPTYDNYKANCFVVGKTAYIGLHNKKNFWGYDTDKNTWRKLKDFPGTPRMDGSGFVYGDKIYFGTGMLGYNTGTYTSLNDWWEYNTTTDTWTQKNNFPVATYSSIGFSNNESCFMSNGYTSAYNSGTRNYTYSLNVLKYDPENDSWNNQTLGTWVDKNSSGMNSWIPCKTTGSEIYVNLGRNDINGYSERMYIIDNYNASMSRIADYPYWLNRAVISININGNVYLRNEAIGTYGNKSFYYYDVASNKWKLTQTNVYSNLAYGIAFEVGSIGFAGLGESNHLYEFDPNR